MAEEVATFLSTPRTRTAGSRKYRLVEESFELMLELYQAGREAWRPAMSTPVPEACRFTDVSAMHAPSPR